MKLLYRNGAGCCYFLHDIEGDVIDGDVMFANNDKELCEQFIVIKSQEIKDHCKNCGVPDEILKLNAPKDDEP